MPKKDNWNTDKNRRWAFDNLGISIMPGYTGDDPFGKPKSQHHNKKFKTLLRSQIC